MTGGQSIPFQSFIDSCPGAPLRLALNIFRCSGLILMNLMIAQAIGIVGLVFNVLGLPIVTTFLSLFAVFSGLIVYQVIQTPEAGLGARRSRGTTKPELTLEALQWLIGSDSSSENKPQVLDADFRFLEVSVQETKDNHLVVFHPTDRKAQRIALPRTGANVAIYEAFESELETNVERLAVGDLTLAQVQSFDLFGQDGSRVPTLQEYLTECRKLELCKPIALELREVHSDKGRAGLLRLVSAHARALETKPNEGLLKDSYEGLGAISVVSDPGRFTACFGEFGSVRWAHWATRMREAEVPVRLKSCHWINLAWLAPEVDPKGNRL